MYELLQFLNFRHGLMLNINAYFACIMNKHSIFKDLYVAHFFFVIMFHHHIFFYFMFKFSIIVMCIQFFFSVLGNTAYLTRNISSYKQQGESGFMLLMQYPVRGFPYPSTRNFLHGVHPVVY
jgi:hypothetical protein